MDAEKIPRQGGAILDIGANMGVISVGMLYGNHFKHAIAIEPDPINFNLLRLNVRQNGLEDRFSCLNAAAGRNEGKLKFELSAINYGDHRVHTEESLLKQELCNESVRNIIEVPSNTLDALLETVPSSVSDIIRLVWIDVQGYECIVFEGGRGVFSRDIPVFAEIWPYGMRSCGVRFDEYYNAVKNLWRYFWVFRKGRFLRYDISCLLKLIEENDIRSERDNIILTKK